jgi:DNA polymerase I-like protein with 3'-5' exonuclease and polymerase domains
MQHEGDISEYYEWLREADYIGADTENSGTTRPIELWSGLHYCTGISTAIERGNRIWSRYFTFRHPADNLDKSHLEILNSILTVKKLGFHNVPIDLAALTTLGIEITIPPHDSIVLAHLVNEELPSKQLDWLAKYIFKKFPEGHPYAVYKQGKLDDKLSRYTDIWGWDDVPVWLMTPYACFDAELQYALTKVLLKEMEP